MSSDETPTVRLPPRKNLFAKIHADIAINNPTKAKSTPIMNTMSLRMERKPREYANPHANAAMHRKKERRTAKDGSSRL
jgi:hypothetical protein